MKWLVIGAHLHAADVAPIATAIPLGDLALSGVEVADDQPLGDRDLLLRVARIRAELLDRATFIAIRYGFTVHGESEAMAKCASYAARWRELLAAHRNDIEMTLKVAAAAPKSRPDRRAFSSGADYLRALHGTVSTADVSDAFRAAAERAMGATHRWTHRDEKSLELAALVARADVGRIRDAGEALKREFPEVPFLLSGPWPLEVFALDEIVTS
jgi:hypothetical protein